MSRCFPFPPPGFEMKITNDNVELVAKKNHEDKRKKKDGKEKKEGKERKHKQKKYEKNGERSLKKKKRKKSDKDKKENKDKNKGGISKGIKRRARDTEVNGELAVDEVKTGTMDNILGDGSVNNKMANNFTTIEQRRLYNASCTNGKLYPEISSCMTEMHEAGSIDRKIHNNSFTMEGRQVGTSEIEVIDMDLTSNEKRVGTMFEGCIVKNEVDGLFGGSRGLLEKGTNLGGIVKGEERMANMQKREKKDKKKGRKKEKKEKRKKTKHKVKDNCGDIEVNHKRKHIDGILDEGDLRPNKLRKTAPISHFSVENGIKSDTPPVATSCLSDCDGDIADIGTSEIIPDNKVCKTNGVVKPQQPEVMEILFTDDKVRESDCLREIADIGTSKRVSSDNRECKINGVVKPQQPEEIAFTRDKVRKVSRKPHPDEKLLKGLLCVPKMEEFLESDMEWLLDRRKASAKITTDITPSVGSKALRIDDGNPSCLPYVLPY